jgi:glycosyltransferase involved in cell wall biosynthesis
MNSQPVLSIIIPTLNNETQIRECLESISRQTYKQIEIIIADGHSTDMTRKICKDYHATIVDNDKILAEPGVRLGFSHSKGSYCMVMAADNVLGNEAFVQQIIEIFELRPDVVGICPQHTSSKTDNLITKYVNEFTDPYSHFVYQYAANIRTFSEIYKVIFKDSKCTIYDFSSNSDTPLLALAQGFTFRKEQLNPHNHEGDDILPVMTLMNAGGHIACAHGIPLYHHTIRDIGHYIRKTRWATYNSVHNKPYGISSRTSYLSHNQQFRRKLWPLYAMSLIIPFLISMKHILKKESYLWLLHAPLCYISACSSIYEYIRYNWDTNNNRISRS